MVRFVATFAALVLLFAAQVASQSSSSVPSSMAPVTKPTTSANGQSGCVQYGSNTFKTETQYSPVTSPGSHSVPNLTDASASRSYVDSLAQQGGSQAYAQNPYSGPTTPVPQPTSVTFNTVVSSDGKKYTTVAVNTQNGASSQKAVPVLFALAVAVVGGALLL